MSLLTKSKYLLGLKCPKLLWITMNAKEQLPKIDQETEHKFKTGTLIGELATRWFADGISVPTNDFIGNLDITQELLKKRKVLFEAGFKSKLQKGDIYSRVDILVPVEDDMWDIVEVKSGTSVKDENIDDVSFQRFCLEEAGLKVRNCFLMHINNQYVKDGEIDVKEFFVKSDMTELVDDRIVGIKDKISQMFDVINTKEEIQQKIGTFCNKPYECPLKNKCWNFLPVENVFDLYRGGKKSFELFDNDILKIADISSDTKLTAIQKIQKDCSLNEKIHINKENINKILDELNYPLYFLDFETINPAIPKFDGMKPYQRIPFQFSLHIQEEKDSEPKHISYLTDNTDDPRPTFIKLLNESLGKSGDIIVYNASFEKGVFKECCEVLPEYKEWYEENIIPRIKDLLEPFRKFDYYNPNQKGSASIKAVLPALSDLSYDNMAISDGTGASNEFERITYDPNVSKDEKAEVRLALEKYCKQDTYAEIIIIEKLSELI